MSEHASGRAPLASGLGLGAAMRQRGGLQRWPPHSRRAQRAGGASAALGVRRDCVLHHARASPTHARAHRLVSQPGGSAHRLCFLRRAQRHRAQPGLRRRGGWGWGRVGGCNPRLWCSSPPACYPRRTRQLSAARRSGALCGAALPPLPRTSRAPRTRPARAASPPPPPLQVEEAVGSTSRSVVVVCNLGGSLEPTGARRPPARRPAGDPRLHGLRPCARRQASARPYNQPLLLRRAGPSRFGQQTRSLTAAYELLRAGYRDVKVGTAYELLDARRVLHASCRMPGTGPSKSAPVQWGALGLGELGGARCRQVGGGPGARPALRAVPRCPPGLAASLTVLALPPLWSAGAQGRLQRLAQERARGRDRRRLSQPAGMFRFRV